MVERIASIKLNDDITIEAVFYSGIVKNFDVKNLFDRWPQYRVLKEDTAILVWSQASTSRIWCLLQ